MNICLTKNEAQVEIETTEAGAEFLIVLSECSESERNFLQGVLAGIRTKMAHSGTNKDA